MTPQVRDLALVHLREAVSHLTIAEDEVERQVSHLRQIEEFHRHAMSEMHDSLVYLETLMLCARQQGHTQDNLDVLMTGERRRMRERRVL